MCFELELLEELGNEQDDDWPAPLRGTRRDTPRRRRPWGMVSRRLLFPWVAPDLVLVHGPGRAPALDEVRAREVVGADGGSTGAGGATVAPPDEPTQRKGRKITRAGAQVPTAEVGRRASP